MPETLRIIAPSGAGEALAAAIREIDDVEPDRLRARLAAPMAAPQDPAAVRDESDAAVLVVLAWLACGRAARVRTLLRALTAAPRDEGAGPPRPELLPLLVARYVAWTGDLRTALAAWPATRAAADRMAGGGGERGTDAGRDLDPSAVPHPHPGVTQIAFAGALAGLERVATDLGDVRLAAGIHARARTAADGLDGRALTGPAALLAIALDLLPPAAAGAEPGAPPPIVPPATATGAVPSAPLPSAAAETVLRAAHVLLGAAPDAPRHRLWLRPRPSGRVGAVETLEARSIVAGEDSVAVMVERRTDGVLARVRQDAGPIPLTLLLELALPGRLRRAEIDGRDADLAPRDAHAGQVVPVQLVLDRERTVEVMT